MGNWQYGFFILKIVFSIHHSRLTIDHSPFTIRHSPLTIAQKKPADLLQSTGNYARTAFNILLFDEFLCCCFCICFNIEQVRCRWQFFQISDLKPVKAFVPFQCFLVYRYTFDIKEPEINGCVMR